MEAEKNKAIQLEEQKKAIDIRLDLELTRNTEFQKEMYRWLVTSSSNFLAAASASILVVSSRAQSFLFHKAVL